MRKHYTHTAIDNLYSVSNDFGVMLSLAFVDSAVYNITFIDIVTIIVADYY